MNNIIIIKFTMANTSTMITYLVAINDGMHNKTSVKENISSPTLTLPMSKREHAQHHIICLHTTLHNIITVKIDDFSRSVEHMQIMSANNNKIRHKNKSDR